MPFLEAFVWELWCPLICLACSSRRVTTFCWLFYFMLFVIKVALVCVQGRHCYIYTVSKVLDGKLANYNNIFKFTTVLKSVFLILRSSMKASIRKWTASETGATCGTLVAIFKFLPRTSTVCLPWLIRSFWRWMDADRLNSLKKTSGLFLDTRAKS